MDMKQKTKLRETLTARRAEQFAFLADLVRQSSENPPGDCREIATYLSAYIGSLGLNVSKYPKPEGDAVINEQGLTNLVVRHVFGDGPTIALVAHADTAIAGANWTHDPFEAPIVDGHMYGCGVVSAKGALAAYVFALLALRDHPQGLSGTVELHITFDGQTGGDLGGRWLLSSKLVAPDLAIAAGTTHSLITAASGCLQLDVTIKGRAASASRPEQGVDALEAAARVMAALYDLREVNAKIKSKVAGIGGPSVIVSNVKGGESPRNVAACATITVSRQLIPEEDPTKVERALTTLIGTAAVKVPGVLCKVRRKALFLPMLATEGTEKLIAAFQRHAPDVLGNQLKTMGTAMDTDGRHYANAGIPTVLYGVGPENPVDANVEGVDEVLALDDLRRSTELLVLVLSDLLAADAR